MRLVVHQWAYGTVRNANGKGDPCHAIIAGSPIPREEAQGHRLYARGRGLVGLGARGVRCLLMEAAAVAAAASLGFHPGDVDLYEAAETWVHLEDPSPVWDDGMLEAALEAAEESECVDGVSRPVVQLEGQALLACLEIADVTKGSLPSDSCCLTFSDEQVPASLSYHLEASDAVLRLQLAEERYLDLAFFSEAPAGADAVGDSVFPSRQASLQFHQHAVTLVPRVRPRPR